MVNTIFTTESTEEIFNNCYELLHPKQTIQYIVVLGGGFTYNPDWSHSVLIL